MKKILSVLIAILLTITLEAQQGKELKYELTQFDSYLVTPITSKGIAEGLHGEGHILNQEKFNTLIFDLIKETIAKEKLEILHARTFLSFEIDSKGNIHNYWYSIDINDINVLTENDLLELISKLKKISIDTKIVKIEKGDYATLGCSLNPKGCRHNK